MGTKADPMSYEERMEKAFERAREERLTCVEVDPATYAVPSRKVMPGDWRYIRRDGPNFLCNCEAATYQNPCTHYATVILALAGELPLRRLPTPQATTKAQREDMGPLVPVEAKALDMPRCTKCGQPSPRVLTGGYCTTCEIAMYYPE